jgi:transposase
MGFLTEEEKAQLRARHKKERDRRICDRIKAVLLYDDGWSIKEIAKVLLLSEDSIRDHIDEYKTFQKLKPDGGGSVEKLSFEQSKELIVHLEKHTYLYVKDIIAYVESKWNISYTSPGMRSWLRRHKFSYKKPALVPGKANIEQQKEWISAYETLKQNLSPNETICFTDGVHPTHNVQLAYGWIRKGIRKEIPSNTGRSRVNISGIIDIISHRIFIEEDQTLDAKAVIKFFKKVEEAYPTKSIIHLFSDNAKYYRNKAVAEYLRTSKIRLHFLPPYSPNLNPIERLWKWMKERVLYNSYYSEFEDFKSAIFGFFKALQNAESDSVLSQHLKSRVKDKFRPIRSPLTDF